MSLRVALVGGPMYDHLYTCLADFDVDVVVHADHPTLNREVGDRLRCAERIDVLATHSKYAPSQAPWLRSLDDLIDVSALAPLAVDLCRPGGTLWSVPRLIDVRIMWVRRDRIDAAPTTWSDIVDRQIAFGFPGRESGLFGTFFELVVGAGGRLFDDDGRPCLASVEAIAAVERLIALAHNAPDDLPDWHYDQVDDALLGGRIDAAGVWPGGWGPIRDSPVADRLEPHPYPAGDERWVSYAGCHAWAIPTTCADVAGAVKVIEALTGFDAHALDASGGNVCAHIDAFAAVEPENEIDRRRLEITTATIERAMITYPPNPDFPALEDAGWAVLHEALRGKCSPTASVELMQQIALRTLI